MKHGDGSHVSPSIYKNSGTGDESPVLPLHKPIQPIDFFSNTYVHPKDFSDTIDHANAIQTFEIAAAVVDITVNIFSPKMCWIVILL